MRKALPALLAAALLAPAAGRAAVPSRARVARPVLRAPLSASAGAPAPPSAPAATHALASAEAALPADAPALAPARGGAPQAEAAGDDALARGRAASFGQRIALQALGFRLDPDGWAFRPDGEAATSAELREALRATRGAELGRVLQRLSRPAGAAQLDAVSARHGEVLPRRLAAALRGAARGLPGARERLEALAARRRASLLLRELRADVPAGAQAPPEEAAPRLPTREEVLGLKLAGRFLARLSRLPGMDSFVRSFEAEDGVPEVPLFGVADLGGRAAAMYRHAEGALTLARERLLARVLPGADAALRARLSAPGGLEEALSRDRGLARRATAPDDEFAVHELEHYRQQRDHPSVDRALAAGSPQLLEFEHGAYFEQHVYLVEALLAGRRHSLEDVRRAGAFLRDYETWRAASLRGVYAEEEVWYASADEASAQLESRAALIRRLAPGLDPARTEEAAALAQDGAAAAREWVRIEAERLERDRVRHAGLRARALPFLAARAEALGDAREAALDRAALAAPDS